MAGRKARLRNPGRLSRKKRAGAVFAKVERRTKTPGVRADRHLFVLVTSHSAASGAAYVASASRRRRATPRRRVLVSYRCLRSDELRAPPRRRRAITARRRTAHALSTRSRASSEFVRPQPSSGARNRFGRRPWPLSYRFSSQPTVRGRAPARLRALERAPCRAPWPYPSLRLRRKRWR